MPDPTPSGLATWLQAGSVIIAALSAAYGFNSWRRQLIGSKKAEVADRLLVSFYEARDTIEAARAPICYEDEGLGRPQLIGETDADARLFNNYWAPAERLIKKGEFFTNFAAAQYKARAYLGDGVVHPFDVVIEARARILTAARMLITSSKEFFDREDINERRQKWERTIWTTGDDSDEIKPDIDVAVSQIEAICRPVLYHVPKYRAAFDWIRTRLASR
jgi:hypothetical protein